jgi:hypothetical protein
LGKETLFQEIILWNKVSLPTTTFILLQNHKQQKNATAKSQTPWLKYNSSYIQMLHPDATTSMFDRTTQLPHIDIFGSFGSILTPKAK